MGEGGGSSKLDTMTGGLGGDSRGSGVIGPCSEGSSCKTSRYEEVDNRGTELQNEGLPAGGRSVCPSPDRREILTSGGGTKDEGGLVPCKYGGAGGPHSDSLLSEVRFTANQLALNCSASVDPWKVMLIGDGTQPRRSSLSRSCSLKSLGGRSPRSRRAASRRSLEITLFGSVGETGIVDLGERGPCVGGPKSFGNVRVDGRDRSWVLDLEGMEMWSFDVTRRINVDFAAG